MTKPSSLRDLYDEFVDDEQRKIDEVTRKLSGSDDVTTGQCLQAIRSWRPLAPSEVAAPVPEPVRQRQSWLQALRAYILGADHK